MGIALAAAHAIAEDPAAELAAVNARADLILAANRLRRLEWRQEARESQRFRESYGPQDFGFVPQRPYPAARGLHRPRRVRTLAELYRRVESARSLTDVNPYVAGLFDDLSAYTVGEGFRRSVVPVGDGLSALAGRVEDVVQEFCERVSWDCDGDHELFRRWRRDGIALIEVFAAEDGADIRFVEPRALAEPQNPDVWADFLVETGQVPPGPLSFELGVVTPADDVENVLGVTVDRGGEFDFVPAERMVLLKANADRCDRVGVSDLGAAEDLLDRLYGMMLSAVDGVRSQARIAGMVEYQAAEAEHIDDLAGGFAEKTRAPQDAIPGGIDAYWHHVPEGRTYKPGPADADAVQTIGLMGQRVVAGRWSLPASMFAADATDTNYASALVAESPFVKRVLTAQSQFGAACRRLFRIVAEIARRQGAFGRDVTVRQLRGVKVDLTPPRVEVRDRLKETQRHNVLYQSGALDIEGFQLAEDIDPEAVAERRARQPVTPYEDAA